MFGITIWKLPDKVAEFLGSVVQIIFQVLIIQCQSCGVSFNIPYQFDPFGPIFQVYSMWIAFSVFQVLKTEEQGTQFDGQATATQDEEGGMKLEERGGE